jgi:hypothetical protein
MSTPDDPLLPPADRSQTEGPEPLGAGIDFTDPNSPLAPYFLQASHLVAVLLLGLIFLFFCVLRLWHTDIWAHLKFGSWILDHGALPDREPFSPFADREYRYINFQWVSQTGLTLVYRLGAWMAGGDALNRMAGGVQLLRGLHALLALLVYGLALAAYRRRANSLPLACGGLVVLLILDPTLLTFFRPQILGVAFFAALLLVLARPLPSRRTLFAVPLLMVLWANCHGSFVVGLYLLGLCLVGAIVEGCQKARSWNPLRAWADARARRLALVLFFSVVAAGLLNPHGPFLYLYAVKLSRHPNIATFKEWQPLEWSLGPGGHWSYLVSVVLLLGSLLLGRRRPSATEFFLLAGFGLWPVFQQRMMAWWALVVPWVIVQQWAALGDRLTWRWLHYQSVPSFRKTFVAGVVVLVLFLQWPPMQWLLRGRPQPLARNVSPGTPWRVAAELTASPGERGQWLPALAKGLKAGYPDGQFRGRVFSTETQGDYLLWALPPEYPVMIYTHIHLFTPEHWRQIETVVLGQPGWRQILDQNGANLVVIEAGETYPRLCALLRGDPDWLVVLDETGTGDRSRINPMTRRFVALRKKPLPLKGN